MPWISIFSTHRDRQPDCPRCDAGQDIPQEEMDANSELFTNDYLAWYRQVNSTDSQPGESGWQNWEQLTGKVRPS